MAAEGKRFFPAFLDLERRLAVVIGEGPRVEKRVRQLMKYDADVVVITPDVSESLVQMEADGAITLEQRGYVRGDLVGAILVLCVTADEEVRRAVFAEADSVGCLCNVAEEPGLSSFFLPSVLHRGTMQLGISTGGMAPEVAKKLRRKLESLVGPEWGSWVALVGEFRAIVTERIEDPRERQRLLNEAADDSVLYRLVAGEEVTAEGLFEELAPAEEGTQE